MFDQKLFSDATIICKDSKRVDYHSAILSARCPGLLGLISHLASLEKQIGFPSCSDNKVHLPDSSFSTIESCLKSLYTQKEITSLNIVKKDLQARISWLRQLHDLKILDFPIEHLNKTTSQKVQQEIYQELSHSSDIKRLFKPIDSCSTITSQNICSATTDLILCKPKACAFEIIDLDVYIENYRTEQPRKRTATYTIDSHTKFSGAKKSRLDETSPSSESFGKCGSIINNENTPDLVSNPNSGFQNSCQSSFRNFKVSNEEKRMIVRNECLNSKKNTSSNCKYRIVDNEEKSKKYIEPNEGKESENTSEYYFVDENTKIKPLTRSVTYDIIGEMDGVDNNRVHVGDISPQQCEREQNEREQGFLLFKNNMQIFSNIPAVTESALSDGGNHNSISFRRSRSEVSPKYETSPESLSNGLTGDQKRLSKLSDTSSRSVSPDSLSVDKASQSHTVTLEPDSLIVNRSNNNCSIDSSVMASNKEDLHDEVKEKDDCELIQSLTSDESMEVSVTPCNNPDVDKIVGIEEILDSNVENDNYAESVSSTMSSINFEDPREYRSSYENMSSPLVRRRRSEYAPIVSGGSTLKSDKVKESSKNISKELLSRQCSHSPVIKNIDEIPVVSGFVTVESETKVDDDIKSRRKSKEIFIKNSNEFNRTQYSGINIEDVTCVSDLDTTDEENESLSRPDPVDSQPQSIFSMFIDLDDIPTPVLEEPVKKSSIENEQQSLFMFIETESNSKIKKKPSLSSMCGRNVSSNENSQPTSINLESKENKTEQKGNLSKLILDPISSSSSHGSPIVKRKTKVKKVVIATENEDETAMSRSAPSDVLLGSTGDKLIMKPVPFGDKVDMTKSVIDRKDFIEQPVSRNVSLIENIDDVKRIQNKSPRLKNGFVSGIPRPIHSLKKSASKSCMGASSLGLGEGKSHNLRKSVSCRDAVAASSEENFQLNRVLATLPPRNQDNTSQLADYLLRMFRKEIGADITIKVCHLIIVTRYIYNDL